MGKLKKIQPNEKFIETKHVETRAIKEKFKRDIERFRALKGHAKHETASME